MRSRSSGAKGAFGAMSLFGLYVEAQHSWSVLCMEFTNCLYSPIKIVARLGSMSEIQVGGVCLYFLLAVTSSIGFGVVLFFGVRRLVRRIVTVRPRLQKSGAH
jgi:hypothetical protein